MNGSDLSYYITPRWNNPLPDATLPICAVRLSRHMIHNSQRVVSRQDGDTTQLLQVAHNPQGREQTLSVFKAFVANKEYIGTVRRLKKEDVVKLINVIDQVRSVGLHRYPPLLDDGPDNQAIGFTDWENAQLFPLLLALGSICSATSQLPSTTILSSGVERCGEIAIASGGFTDTWRGLYQTKTVALKAFRTYPSQDLKEAKKVRYTTTENVY